MFALLYAIGSPLPFPEGRPWKMSFQYWLFTAVLPKLGGLFKGVSLVDVAVAVLAVGTLIVARSGKGGAAPPPLPPPAAAAVATVPAPAAPALPSKR